MTSEGSERRFESRKDEILLDQAVCVGLAHNCWQNMGWFACDASLGQSRDAYGSGFEARISKPLVS